MSDDDNPYRPAPGPWPAIRELQRVMDGIPGGRRPSLDEFFDERPEPLEPFYYPSEVIDRPDGNWARVGAWAPPPSPETIRRFKAHAAASRRGARR